MYMPTARAQPSQLKVTGRITGNTLDAHVEGQAASFLLYKDLGRLATIVDLRR
jgi:hypothetical protein